jgi:serine/threonine protein kinase
LGRGEFCLVYEIDKVTLSNKKFSGSDVNDDAELVSFMERNCLRGKNEDRRYAVKRLKPSTVRNESSCVTGIADLALEVMYLSLLGHPNIIKMRAVATCNIFDKDFFIVMDRLHETLPKRLTKWKVAMPKGISKLFDRRGRKVLELWSTRLAYAHDLSCALDYMHKSK